MATLTGATIASTYPLLLKIKSGGIDGSMKFVQDGDGTDSAFKISTAGATVLGTLTVGVDDTGADVQLFGATTGHYLLWDQSEDDLILAGANSVLSIDSTVDSSSTTTGSFHTDGGVGIALDLFVGDDLSLLSDSAVFNMGAGNDFTITHDGTTGATLAGTPISINSTGDLTLDSTTDIVLDAAGGNFEFKDAGVAQLTIDVDGTAGDIDVNLKVNGDDLVFNQYDGTEVMRITDTAFVGIGEDTPIFPLHVKGRDDASSPNYVAMFDNLGADSDSHGIQIQAGDTNHSDSGTHYIVFKESDGGAVGELDSDSGALALSDASDERLKKNIVDTSTKGLEIINGTRMRDFDWKKNDLSIKCGIIAQELQSVFPKAVKECDDEDKTLRIRKTDFIYVLVKAAQELSASNDALKARIEVLEAA